MDRQHILEEIRRTAEANGNKPLGMQRFEKETGIKRSDWIGKHWARWGDAVREAGFAANLFVAPHDEDSLIESYIGLVRELGRLPVEAEIRMKDRRDPSFPSHTTFRERFGSKGELASRVLEYCRQRGGFEDVVQLCEKVTIAVAAPGRSVAEQELGFVYLLKAGRFYKIGKTNAVGRRERELAIQLPQKAHTVHVIKTDDPTGIEAYWHNRFESKRANGEWFDLEAADVIAFKRRKFM